MSGLAKVETPGEQNLPHRPFKILYASLYADVRPTFVVDITPYVEERLRALLAYRSQYASQAEGEQVVCPGGGDSRADVGGGTTLWVAGGSAVWGAVCAEGSGAGGGFDDGAGAVDLAARQVW